MIEITGVNSPISEILSKDEKSFLAEWIAGILATTRGSGSMPEAELRIQCETFLSLFRSCLDKDGSENAKGVRWEELRELLAEISKSRATRGYTATETAKFIFSFKKPLFQRLGAKIQDPQALAEQTWGASELLDGLGLYTAEAFLKTREDLIRRAQDEMLELSTPVVKLWDGILALPIIGTLDSARTQIVMETLLEAIVNTNSKVAIIDITGVATVDTVVAQHLLKTVTAARLMGAECIISGIRPQIAQTIVHLGINMMDVRSKATLKDAFALALEQTGQRVTANTE